MPDVWACLVSGESYLLHLQKAAFSCCAHIAQRERPSRASSLVSLYKGTNIIMLAPPLWFHLNLITSQSFHLQIPLQWGLELQHLNFGGMQFSSKHMVWHSRAFTTSSKLLILFYLLLLHASAFWGSKNITNSSQNTSSTFIALCLYSCCCLLCSDSFPPWQTIMDFKCPGQMPSVLWSLLGLLLCAHITLYTLLSN